MRRREFITLPLFWSSTTDEHVEVLVSLSLCLRTPDGGHAPRWGRRNGRIRESADGTL
jgi:hypothetical protein